MLKNSKNYLEQVFILSKQYIYYTKVGAKDAYTNDHLSIVVFINPIRSEKDHM